MRTPSLVSRIVVIGVVIVAALTLAIDILVYVTLRSSLTDNVEATLAADARTAREEATRLGVSALPGRLAELGIRASVRRPDGTEIGRPGFGSGDDLAFRTVALPDGSTVRVATSRSDANHPLRRLLRLELVISPLVVALAVLVLRLIGEIALRPLDQIAAAARRTAEGRRGERLRPDRPDTRLGQVASTYDEMLDALEAAIADARQAQLASHKLEERYRQILQTAREAFIAFDERGVILEWNAEAERTFGWPRDEAVGRVVADIILPAGEPAGPFADPEWLLTSDDGAPADRLVEFTAVHRDGHSFRAGSTVWVTPWEDDAIINAFVWDVTERLAAQEAVSRLAGIVESSEEAILSTGLDGIIRTWNRGAEVMYGYSAEEAVGRHLSLIVPERWQSDVGQVLTLVRNGTSAQRFKALRRRKDGRHIRVALTISPIRDEDGNIVGCSSVARDVTDQERASDERNRLLSSRESALAKARASEEATRRFLDDAAHQLRAPITSLRASAETLLRGADAEERDRLLGAVVRETSRASRLMSSLLQMARLDHGRRLAFHACDVVALCHEEAERVRSLAPRVEVSVSTNGGAPVGQPQVDSQAVSEIVANLLDNARRHAESRIDVVVTRRDRDVELRVVNDGPAVPSDKAETIFDRFVSLDGGGGSGLGLPIARQLARAHSGDLVYEDGAFVLRLPARR